MLSKEELFEEIIKDYADISKLIRNEAYDRILCNVAGLFDIEPLQLEKLPISLVDKGTLDSSYGHLLGDLIRNINKYDWVYKHLADERSREVFTNLVRYRVIPDSAFLENAMNISQEIQPGDEFLNCAGSKEIVAAKGVY